MNAHPHTSLLLRLLVKHSPSFLAVGWLLGVSMFPVRAHEAYSFRHYTTADGLPHDVGYEMIQDEAGYLWIGTDNGLVRYDGNRFTTYRVSEGLPTPYAITLSRGIGGHLWVGHHRNLLYKWDCDSAVLQYQQEFAHQDPKLLQWDEDSAFSVDVHPSLNPAVYSLSTRQEGQWTHVYGGILRGDNPQELRATPLSVEAYRDYANAIAGRNAAITTTQGQQAPKVRSWYQDPTGRIWLATYNGLFLHQGGLNFRQVPGTEGLALESVVQGADGALWLGGRGMLYQWRPGMALASYQVLPQDELIIQLRVASSGQLYFITQSRQQLFTWQPDYQDAHSLNEVLNLQGGVSYLYLDQMDQLWFTTNGDGLYCVYEPAFTHIHLKGMTPNAYMLSTRQTNDGTIWLSTRYEAFSYRQDQLRPFGFRSLNLDRPLHVQQLLQREDHIIVVTTHGLFGVDARSGDTSSCDFWQHLSIIETKPEGYTLLSYDTSSVRASCVYYTDLRPHALTDIFLTSRAVDADGREWLGSTLGLWFHNGIKWVCMGPDEGLNHHRINDLIWQGDTLWIATDLGVCYWYQGYIRPFNACRRLAHASVRYLIADRRGRIWMASSSGLFCYDRNEVYSFHSIDGLPTNDINHLMIDQDEVMWVSTSAGLAQLALHKALPIQDPPSIFFHHIQVDGSVISPQEESQLAASQDLRVSFGTISFTYQQYLLWQYRLQPGDPWQPIDVHELALSNLRDGAYQLQVRGRFHNSSWSDPVVWTFSVARPWYRWPLWWVLGGMTLVGLLGLLFIRLQRRRAQQEAQRLTIGRRLADLELKALQAQMNPHFIFNALNAIQHFILQHEVETANDYLSRFAWLVRRFLEASRQRFHSLEQEVDLLRDYLEMEHLCYGQHFAYEVVPPKGELLDWEVPSLLLQPLAENAIRHGLIPRSSPGLLHIRFFLSGERLVCVVEDNGVGRAHAQAKQNVLNHQSRGLQLLSERIDTLNRAGWGPIEWDIVDLSDADGNSTGTRILLYLSD